MKTNLLFFTSFCIFLFSCGGDTKKENKSENEKIIYPDTWQKDMSVEIGYGGGMTPDSHRIFISMDSCWMVRTGMDIENKWYFSLVTDYLDELAAFIKENDVANIKTIENNGTIHDKGTTELIITLGGKSYRIADSATGSVEKDKVEKFRKVYDKVYSMANFEINKQSSIFYFLPDKKLLSMKPEIYISDYDYNSIYSSKENGYVDSIYFFLRPGDHNFSVIIKDSAARFPEINTNWKCKTEINEKSFARIKLEKNGIVMDSVAVKL